MGVTSGASVLEVLVEGALHRPTDHGFGEADVILSTEEAQHVALLLEIGYDSSRKGFDGHSCGISVSIGTQSPDVARGVETGGREGLDGLDRQGAGDQGLVFGYACDEKPEPMPLPIHLAHRLSRQPTEVRRYGTIPYLRPGGKTQVTIEYDGDRAVRLATVVVPTRDHPRPRPAPCDPRPDRRPRALRPRAAGFHLGAHRPHRRPARSGLPISAVRATPWNAGQPPPHGRLRCRVNVRGQHRDERRRFPWTAR